MLADNGREFVCSLINLDVLGLKNLPHGSVYFLSVLDFFGQQIGQGPLP